MRTVTTSALLITLLLTLIGVSGPPTASAAPASAAPKGHPWDDRGLPAAQRARLVLAQMTLTEKIDLMTGDDGAPYAFYNAAIPRLGIPALKMADAGSGVADRGWQLPGTLGRATALPAEVALGATFSTDVAHRYASLIADEVRATGQNVLLGPDTDIARQPWFGRLAESYGEDPVLNATLSTAYVKALQDKNVLATLKHYTGYNQETDRNIGQNSIIDERTLREVYALAFEAAVTDADLGAVMCSYNKINGDYSCENAHTLRTVLKGRIGFTGFVMTDFGALHDTLGGARGGTDMETGSTTIYDGALLAAVQSGQVPVGTIDAAVLRILTTLFRVGLFDTDNTPTSIAVAAHDQAARQIETQAITLLKNSHQVLPLDDRDQVALIGADVGVIAAESGSSYVDPVRTTTVLQGLQDRAGQGKLSWTPGNDSVNAASMIETADRTAVPSSVLTPLGGGAGLTAEYWSNPTFDGPSAETRIDDQVSYDVGFASTFPGWAGAGTQVPVTPTRFFLEQGSATWDGYLTAPATGSYTLSLTGWGDATLTLDGRRVVTMTGRDGRRVIDSAALPLTAGVRHRLHISYQATRPLTDLQPGTLLLQWKTPARVTSPAIDRAVVAAKKAKVAVVYVRTFESEERDRVSLKLPQSADVLIRAVAKANPRTVVVLASGGPVIMPWIKDVAGVVQTYFGGQAQGAALADVLYGDAEPGGRLPVSYPRIEADVPVANPWDGIGNLDVRYAEGLNVGYKGYAAAGTKPLFPFGYGLSYTRFHYTPLPLPVRVSRNEVEVRALVTNVGRRTGTTVAQAYVELPGWTGEPRRLAGFTRVRLQPWETRLVMIKIRVDAGTHPLSTYDTSRHRWVTPSGRYRVFVGPSSADTPMRTSFQLR